jgi:hypothetical protein
LLVNVELIVGVSQLYNPTIIIHILNLFSVILLTSPPLDLKIVLSSTCDAAVFEDLTSVQD